MKQFHLAHTFRSPRLVALAMILTASLVAPVHLMAQGPKHTDGSDLGLTIMGSIVRDKGAPEDNVALVKDGSGHVLAVKKDFVIQDKYKVVAVTKQYIDLVTRDGKRYMVFQDKFAADGGKKGGAAAPAPTLTGPQDTYREDGFERSKGKIVMTGMYRDKLVKEDLAKVLMQATAEPYLENGQIIGFKLSQIDEGSIFAKSGLQNGDVVTAINGQELNSVAGSIKFLQTLKGADHIDVDLRRDGVNTKFSVDVR